MGNSSHCCSPTRSLVHDQNPNIVMDETMQIVSEFVDHAQGQMPSTGVESLIPNGITKMIMSFTGNYFDNWGQFQWNITDQALLEAMKTAPNGTAFHSTEFQMGRMRWQIIAYPNGDNPDNEDLFRVLLQPLSFDNNWEKILFFRKMEIVECGHCCSLVSSKKMGESSEATPVFIPGFQDYESVTIRVEVKMLKIVLKKTPFTLFKPRPDRITKKITSDPANLSSTGSSCNQPKYPHKTSFTYRIDERLMALFAEQRRRGFTHSNNVQDGKWVMYYFPRW